MTVIDVLAVLLVGLVLQLGMWALTTAHNNCDTRGEWNDYE